MPTLIASGLAALFTSGIVTVGITAAAYAITFVGTIALSSYQKRKAERAQRAANEASTKDRLVNTQGTIVPRELVLGRTRKGGNVFYQASLPPYNAIFLTTIALAAHEIDAIEKVYFNDQPIEIDGDGNVVTAPWGRFFTRSATFEMTSTSVDLLKTPLEGSVAVMRRKGAGETAEYERMTVTVSGTVVTIPSYDSGSQYSGNFQYTAFESVARVFWHLGSPGQAADARLQFYLPNIWTADHRAAGIAYLECEFIYAESAFPSGLPAVSALIRGAKLYDPRTGLTAWSENPALMMRHVLTHPQFGKRTSITAAEDAKIIAAANDCEIPISYNGVDVVPMFRAAAVVQFGAPARDVLDDLSQAMGGEWAYAGAEIIMRAGVYRLPVMNLTERDLATVQRDNSGAVSQNESSISPHRPRNDKINIVAPRIADQAANYVETAIFPYRADTLIAADGAELSQEVSMPAVFYAGQAYHIAGIMLRDGRDPLTYVGTFKMSAYPLELFDGVTLTLARYGWSNKEFRILGRSFVPGGGVQLTLKETNSAIFAYGAGFVPQGYSPNTNLPKPWDIHPPVITAISSGESELVVQNDGTVVDSIRVQWLPIQDASILSGGSVEVQYVVLPGNGSWQSVVVTGDSTEARLFGVNDNDTVVIRARTFNSLATSDWTLHQYHRVIGKTEPPPNIENLTIAGSILSWTLPRRVPDLAGFVFRFHYGNNLDWNSATPLHAGIITDNPWEPKTRPGGVVTIMGKAIDTSGNLSLASANIVMNLGDAPIANIVEQWDFNALGWPYSAPESSGWTLVSGKPTANALDSFYGTDDQSFYGEEVDSFYDAGVYGQMVYVTDQISVSSALAGSIMTLAINAQGTDLRVEYRLAGPTSFYGSDGDSFYGGDADSFYDAPGDWLPWPGQMIADRDVYQFRVTIGAGPVQGILQSMVLTIDAPDLEESIEDLVIASTGTTIPYTKAFTAIKTVQATLQANGSGAETVEIDKSVPLAPRIRAFNSAHTAVSGAKADIVIRGY